MQGLISTVAGLEFDRVPEPVRTHAARVFADTVGVIVGRLVKLTMLVEALDLGRLCITRNYLKLYSACALSQSALDAVLALGLSPADQMVSVGVEMVSNSMKIARRAKPNDLSPRFSLPYAVAATIVHGHTGPEAFASDERIAGLAECVEPRPAEELEDTWPDAAPARLTVYFRNGARSYYVNNLHGHHANSARPGDLYHKFGYHIGKGTDSLYERLIGVEDVEDMAAIFEVAA